MNSVRVLNPAGGGAGGHCVLVLCMMWAMATGCAPDNARLSVSTDSIVIGPSQLNAAFTVSASGPNEAGSILLTPNVDWLEVRPDRISPQSHPSPITVTVHPKRSATKLGQNHARITISAPEFPSREVTVVVHTVLAVGFSASPQEAIAGEPVAFVNQTRMLTGADPVTAWHWDFGDGDSSVEQNPVHIYSRPGTYTVSLTGMSRTLSDTCIEANFIRVRDPAAPAADFVASILQPRIGQPVQFNDLSLPGSTPISGWLWDFGDGAWSVERDPMHVYKAAAVYDVYLTVTSSHGRSTKVKLGYMDVQPLEIDPAQSPAIPLPQYVP